MKRTSMILTLVLAMMLMMPAYGANAESATSEALPLVCQGVFEYTMTPAGYDPMFNYFHFYPSGVFYASQYNGSQFAAGYYEIKDEPGEYTDKQGNVYTASQTIVMTLTDGTEYEACPYDAEKGHLGKVKHVYDNLFVQNLDTELTSADENGVALIEYMLGEDDYSLLRFMHNGTFQDTIGPFVEGNYVKDGNTYTMTDMETNQSYTFVANEDYTGAYTGMDGETMTLNLIRAAETVLSFYGNIAGAYGEMVAELKCLEDDTAELVISYAGRDIVSKGTWALASDYSAITLVIENVDYSAPRNTEDNSFSFEYNANDGKEDVTLAMSTKEPVTTLYTFVGENNDAVTLECYSDGTCALIYTGMGTVTTGTWTLDKAASPLPKWAITLAETFENAKITIETDYATKYYFTFKNAGGQLEVVLALPFTALQ